VTVTSHSRRLAYDSASLQVTKIAGGLRVNVGSSMEFDLHELTASDRRAELQQLLVGMGRLIETLQTNLVGNVNTHTCAHMYSHRCTHTQARTRPTRTAPISGYGQLGRLKQCK